WLSTKPIITSGTTPTEAMYQNKDRLILQLPKLTGDQLREMWIGWVTTDPVIVGVWQAVLSHIKGETRAYTWDMTFPGRDEVAEVKRRASPEAMALYLKGCTLTDFFGNRLTLRERRSLR